jgi:hypothetical protein
MKLLLLGWGDESRRGRLPGSRVASCSGCGAFMSIKLIRVQQKKTENSLKLWISGIELPVSYDR